jgi:protein-S-isoprenylcysteine O-methyltransferase Ste14
MEKLNHFLPEYIGALTIAVLIGMVSIRVILLWAGGIKAMHFGNIDKKDFLIPPFVLFYFYLVFADAFHWPRKLFQSEAASWAGVFFCSVGVLLLLWSLVSFGRSFRVGIDVEHPDKLITTGIFNISRNPTYLAFGLVLIGQFLIFPDFVFLAYLVGAALLIHRQVLREEVFLKGFYGADYTLYCGRVRRYL